MKNKFDLETIVQKAQGGDETAFEELYRLGFDPVYYRALRVLKNSHDAADIAQDTFVTAFMKIGELKEPKTFQKWMGRIVYTKCFNYLNRQKRLNPDEVVEEMDSSLFEENKEFLPEHVLTSKETKTELLKAIDELSDRQRVTLMLFYFEEMSLREIAEMTESTEGAVRKRLFDAREILKAKLTKQEAGVMTITLPILSSVLFEDMKTAIPEAVRSSVWNQVAPQVGAAAQNAAKNNPSKGSGNPIINTIISTGLAAVIIVGAVSGFASLRRENMTGVIPDVTGEDILDNTTPLTQPEEPIIKESDSAAVGGAASTNSSPPRIPGESGNAAGLPKPQENPGPHPETPEEDVLDDETPLSDLPDGFDPDETDDGSGNNSGSGNLPDGAESFIYYVTLKNPRIEYKAGTVIPLSELLIAAGVSYYDETLPVEITGYEKIDFNKPSEYDVNVAVYKDGKRVGREIFIVKITK